MKQKNYLVLSIFVLFVSGCGGGDGSDDGGGSSSNTQEPIQTIFGVGGTSGILASTTGVNDVVSQLRSPSLTRDPSQSPPNDSELLFLRDFDFSRTVSAIETSTYTNSMNRLKTLSKLSSNVPFYVEIDLRVNPPVSQIRGGHAGHEYFSVDGRFVDMANEIANYYAMRDFSRSLVDEIEAIDQIVFFHNLNVGGASMECCFQLSLLTNQERERSDYYFWSIFAVMAYHEFGHYYLYHALDQLRSSIDFTGLILYSSVIEDDADFIAGALSAKAELDIGFGEFAYDLLFYYSAQGIGQLFSISQVFGNPALQLYQSSPNYSSLSVRKQNFRRGYNAY